MRQNSLAFAQVRIQARLAARPSDAEWQVIETGRDFAQTLDAVKRTSLEPFVTRLGRDSDIAALEQALCTSWGERVTDVSKWVPLKWRPALLWLRPLPHLRLAQSAWPPGFLSRSEARLLQGEPEAIAAAWRREFARRLPHRIERLGAAATLTLARFSIGPPRSAQATAALAAQLERVVRRQPQEPAAIFAWLGLVALMLERLRGALLLPLLFPAQDLEEAA